MPETSYFHQLEGHTQRNLLLTPAQGFSELMLTGTTRFASVLQNRLETFLPTPVLNVVGWVNTCRTDRDVNVFVICRQKRTQQ